MFYRLCIVSSETRHYWTMFIRLICIPNNSDIFVFNINNDVNSFNEQCWLLNSKLKLKLLSFCIFRWSKLKRIHYCTVKKGRIEREGWEVRTVRGDRLSRYFRIPNLVILMYDFIHKYFYPTFMCEYRSVWGRSYARAREWKYFVIFVGYVHEIIIRKLDI